MTDESDTDATFDRRRVLRTAGALGAAAALPVGSAGAEPAPDAVVDDLDLSAAGPREVLVVFDTNEDARTIADHADRRDYYVYRTLPIAYARLDDDQIREVAARESVRLVEKNRELEYHNDESREMSGAEAVQNAADLGYTGASSHVVVIDSGISPLHPDHSEKIAGNYTFTNPLGDVYTGGPGSEFDNVWVDVGDADTDDYGHGTHVSGTAVGTGTQSDGEWAGMAPDATLTTYATSYTAGVGLSATSTAAYDHMVARALDDDTDFDPQVVNNSYGPAGSGSYSPNGPSQVAARKAFFDAGIVSVWSAGNDGPGEGTLNTYGQGPTNLLVAANDKDGSLTGFSSRGVSGGSFDRAADFEAVADSVSDDGTVDGGAVSGLDRPSVGAVGANVISANSPNDYLFQSTSAIETPIVIGEVPPTGIDDNEAATDPYYGIASGTSMSSPAVAGVVALVADAYRQNSGEFPDPLDVVRTVEAEALPTPTQVPTVDDTGDVEYTTVNIGAGFVDAVGAVERAENGDLIDSWKAYEKELTLASDA